MYRRVLSLLLLPSLLFNQAGALCHEHDVDTPAGHGVQPHVHVSLLIEHTQGHSHHQDGHPHCHDEDESRPEPPRPIDPQGDSQSRHNADAVYFPVQDLCVERGSLGGEQVGSVWYLVGHTSSQRVALWTQSVTFRGHPPPPPHHTRPLYIRHLALLL